MELTQTVAWIYRQRSEEQMEKLQLGWILFPRYDEDYWSSLEAYKKDVYKRQNVANVVAAIHKVLAK